ncbi:hypothetical protein ABC974_08810 [Sphingomonas oligophenolica]|uniref:Uncharacterized protein n=1 Tax=Sphingomonas oligophenolica TaxID=301154 RepID=A0ABU9Y1R9_9SPHN
MSDMKNDTPAPAVETADKPEWVKPEITSFAPVQAAEGISYRPNDGISNLT